MNAIRNGSTLEPPDRLLELLADRATDGLSTAEQRELDALLVEHPDVDESSFDLAAAELSVALMSGHERLPANLASTVQRQFAAQPRAQATPARQLASSSPRYSRAPQDERVIPSDETPRSIAVTRVGRAGWLAAAACGVLAVTGWWPRLVGPSSPSLEPASVELARFESMTKDIKRASWESGNVADAQRTPVTGEVIWSPSEQRGFLVFRGLPCNDPHVEQYQLWVFDEQRDEATPVHGGVFDAVPDADGRVVVEFQPRLMCKNVTLLAVTVEQPGGVWVSKRERIPALAKLQ
jgi:hypothetical protein